MFMDDQARFDRSDNHRLKYLYDEKTLLGLRDISRIQTKKELNKQNDERVQNIFKTIDAKEQDKRRT